MKGLHKIRQKWNDSKLGRNDISVRIYLSFVVVLAVSLLLTGAIFNYLYQRNYTRSYTELLTKQGKKILMTKKEIETMWTLASTPGKVFTRDNLLDSLWGYDYYGDSRTVDSHIKRLRAKLDSVPHPDWTIKTIWGVGYKLEIAGGQ